MKRLFTFIIGLFLFVSLNGQILRYSNYTVGDTLTWQGVIGDTNTIGWYDATKTSSITKDGSNLVSSWADLSGNGNDLVQTTETYKPTWTDAAFDFISFADDDILADAAFALSQPVSIWIVLRNESFTNFDYVMRFNSSPDYHISQTNGPTFTLNMGTALSKSVSEDTWDIYEFVLNGVSSSITINNGAATTGDANTGSLTYFRIGHTSLCADVDIAEIIVRDQEDIAESKTLIYNYLNTKY